jgi:multidrug efflux pump subunit AcrB
VILSDTAIRNRTTVGVLAFIIILGGIYSYLTLPREASPDVPIPIVMISVPYEGVSPADIESSVTMKIEKKLTGLKGVKEIRSTSAEGQSLIIIEFLPDILIEDALQYVRDKVDQAGGDLPTDEARKEPVISEINIADFPILFINMSGNISAVRLKAIADDMEDAIEEVPGVLNVDILGGLEREIRLEIDPDRLAKYNLTIPEVLRLIPSENVNVSAGGLETAGTKFNVRVPAEFVDPGEVDHLPLATRDGKIIYLSDVAKVSDTFKDRSTYSRLDKADTITLAVQKRVGENLVDLADHVKLVLAEAEKVLPESVKFDITLDVSKEIRTMVADLENNMAAAFTLVALILLVFMGWRASLMVAIAVPMSMFLSFAMILALGYTLNMIVLFSLILAIGMLVDNAIVIVENIYRHIQLGYSRIDAARKGTAEVAWPVITSTLTTVAAFFPMLFWPGVMGDFMKYLPATVIIVLLSSLFVALVVNPTICSIFGVGKMRADTGDNWFYRGYRRMLVTALQHRFTTLSLCVLLLVGLTLLYGKRQLGLEFFPNADPDRALVNIRLPQGTNIKETDRITRMVEDRLAPSMPYIKHVVTNIGSTGGGDVAMGGSGGGPHMGNLTIVFPDYEDRKRSGFDVIAEIRDNLMDIPGAEIKVEREEGGPPRGDPVTMRIIGKDFKELERLSGQAKALIAGTPGLVNLRSDLEATRPELAFRIDRRRAMLLGVNTATVGNFLKTAIFGNKVGTYRQYNDEYDITVRLPVTERMNIEDLFRLRVPNEVGQPVPLSSLGTFEYTGGFGTINRVNQKRVVTLTGGAEGRLGDAVLQDVQARMQDFRLPPGYEVRYAGEKEEQDKAAAFLGKAFIIAVLSITLILIAQFNTFTVPLIIMSTVILSMIGVFLGLIVHHMPFGIIMTGIGVISLAGVVVNNAIVLLDYTRQLQRRGMDLVEATIEAGVTRLRPVLLTASTTIIGLIPMASGQSFDFHAMHWATRSQSSEWWASMAIAVIYGLAFATILTLVVVPSMYVSIYRIAVRFGLGGLQKVDTPSPEQPQPEEPEPALR